MNWWYTREQTVPNALDCRRMPLKIQKCPSGRPPPPPTPLQRNIPLPSFRSPVSEKARSAPGLIRYSPTWGGIKTDHYIIFFVPPLHSKPGMESHCWPSTDQLTWWDYGIKISQVWPSCWLWGILIMVGCVLSQLKPSELYILSCWKGLGLVPRPFSQLRM